MASELPIGTDRWTISLGSRCDIVELEPMWVAVHRVHAASMPELAPYVSDAETWVERRALYESLFERHDCMLLLAREGERLIGYALGYVLAVGETWIADTWRTGNRVAEIESVSVLPDQRGNGLGTILLDQLDAQFAARGVDDVILGVLPGNEAARRLYARRGFTATWLYMSRFAGRTAQGG